MTNVQQIIGELEQQRTAIDQAITALRGTTAAGSTATTRSPAVRQQRKRTISPEGRRRIAEAQRQRWAAKHAAEALAASKKGRAGVKTKRESTGKNAGRKSSAAKGVVAAAR